jgi:hypothetical protein
MAIQITNPEIEQEILDLAMERGQSIDDLIETAVRGLKARPKSAISSKPSVDEILQLIRGFPPSPVNYQLSEDEILGYGPNGLCE